MIVGWFCDRMRDLFSMNSTLWTSFARWGLSS